MSKRFFIRRQLAYQIGTVFGQKEQLWTHLTPYDNFRFFGAVYDLSEKETEARIGELAERFALGEFIDTPVRNLSLGQRIRCEIVASLIHKPKVLFLDEPTIGLDPAVKENVRALIMQMNREERTTVFLTSHDVGDIEKLCRRIIIVNTGQIVLDDSVERLKSHYLDRQAADRGARCMPWRKYVVIYRSVLLENLQYAANIAMGFFGYAVFIYTFIKLWEYMYQTPGELIAGYTKEQMIWYVMMTEMIWFGSNAASVAREVSRDIRGGNIAYLINKPYHYTGYVPAKYTGEWSVRLPMYAALAAVIGAVMVGAIPRFSPAAVPAMALCVVLGLTINAVFKLCISLFSFWIEDTAPFQWLYDKLLLVVGTIFPVEIFPEILQPLFKLTPIYTVCYGPAKLIVDFSPEKCVEILAAQAVYLAAGLGLMFLIYRKGVKKLYVNGG